MGHVTNISFFKSKRNKFLVLAGALTLSFAFLACNGGGSTPPDELPVITNQPEAVVATVKGSNITLSVIATGALSYQWVKGTSDTLAGQTLSTLVLTNVDTVTGATYKVLVKNNAGSVTSSSTKVYVFGSEHLSEYFLSRTALADTGLAIFEGNCTGCHGGEGHGYAGSTPPLVNSDFFINNRHRTIRIVLGGYDGVPITVNGLNYEGSMPSWSTSLSNVEIAGVLTYLRSVKNDSTVTSCNAAILDEEGFAKCIKVPRSPAVMALDTVAVWEVKVVRDSLIRDSVITD